MAEKSIYPVYSGAVKLSSLFFNSREASYDREKPSELEAHVEHDEAPDDVQGPFIALVKRDPTEILLSNLGAPLASLEATEMFGLGLSHSGQGRVVYSNIERGECIQLHIQLVGDTLNGNVLELSIERARDYVGQGWERDGDLYKKVFPVNDPKEITNVSENRQAQRRLLNAILTGDSFEQAIGFIYLDGEGRKIDDALVEKNYSLAKRIALTMTKGQAAQVNAAIGTGIGRSRDD